MNTEQNLTGKKVVFFDLDNVIYPEKDYLLQVYYLFAQFIEYTEQLENGPVVQFMQKYLEENGSENIFAATALKFSIPLKYSENFLQLHKSARLPLKLLLFKDVLTLMQEAHQNGILLLLLVSGDPEQQLNKIRQIEWNGLETSIKVYFLEELKLNKTEGANLLQTEFGLKDEEVLHYG